MEWDGPYEGSGLLGARESKGREREALTGESPRCGSCTISRMIITCASSSVRAASW